MTLHTPKQVAKLLQTSKTQVLTYIETGKLKAKRFSPRIIRITDAALQEFLKNAQ